MCVSFSSRIKRTSRIKVFFRDLNNRVDQHVMIDSGGIRERTEKFYDLGVNLLMNVVFLSLKSKIVRGQEEFHRSSDVEHGTVQRLPFGRKSFRILSKSSCERGLLELESKIVRGQEEFRRSSDVEHSDVQSLSFDSST
jgi:hypothetical protein